MSGQQITVRINQAELHKKLTIVEMSNVIVKEVTRETEIHLKK